MVASPVSYAKNSRCRIDRSVDSEQGRRARVQHIFGAQDAMGGHFGAPIGLRRAEMKIGMMNLVHNDVWCSCSSAL